MKIIRFIIDNILPFLILAGVLYNVYLTSKPRIKKRQLAKRLRKRIGPRVDVNGQAIMGKKNK